jgi:hypothetical protein
MYSALTVGVLASDLGSGLLFRQLLCSTLSPELLLALGRCLAVLPWMVFISSEVDQRGRALATTRWFGKRRKPNPAIASPSPPPRHPRRRAVRPARAPEIIHPFF